MSDIITNALRYDATNTFRYNLPVGQGTLSGGKLAFDCSHYMNWVYKESGYNVGYIQASSVGYSNGNLLGGAQNYFNPVATQAMKAGDTVFFNGHMGVVISYNPVTKTGEFYSSTTSSGIRKATFATDPDTATNRGTAFGKAGTQFLAGAQLKPELYDPALDLHLNGSNPSAVAQLPGINGATGVVYFANSSGLPPSNVVSNTPPQTLTSTASGIPFQQWSSPTNTVWMYDNGATVIQYKQDFGTFKAGDIFWSVPIEGGRLVQITQFANNGMLNVTIDRYGNTVSTHRTLADGSKLKGSASHYFWSNHATTPTH